MQKERYVERKICRQDVKENRQIDLQIDRCKVDRCIDRQMYRYIIIQIDRCRDRQMQRQIDVQIGRCIDRQMYRQIDVQIDEKKYIIYREKERQLKRKIARKKNSQKEKLLERKIAKKKDRQIYI